MAESTSPLFDCNSKEAQEEQMRLHTITEAQFTHFVESLTGKPPAEIKPYQVAGAEVEKAILAAGVTCDHYIRIGELAPDAAVPATDNSNLKFEVDDVRSEITRSGICGYYPMALFKGFFNEALSKPPAAFDFYKANRLSEHGEVMHTTVIFRINISGGGVSYWDLSSTIPPKK